MKRLAITPLILVGCAAIQPTIQQGTLILKPQIHTGVYTHTAVPLYSKSSIESLTLALYTVNGETEQPLGIQKTISQADLDNSIVFSALKANTTYRIKASAYASNSLLISTGDASCSTDVALTDNDHPVVAPIRVQLKTSPFNGAATSSLAMGDGVYVPTGPESMQFLGITGVVSTFAGSGVAGFADGVGTAASFCNPRALGIDAAGNLYVGDREGYRIRKVTPAGVVTTIAGNGTVGFVDGPSSMMSSCVGLWSAPNGTVYFMDRDYPSVRKIVNGVVTTIAGDGTVGYVDGPGNTARFNFPRGVAVDTSGNIFVSDSGNNCIRKVAPNATVTTFAGNGTAGFADGTGQSALFYGLGNLAIDAQNNLYVTDVGNQRIRKITPAGVVTTLAGNGLTGYADGLGTNVMMNTPYGITLDPQGNIYFTEDYNNRVRKLSPQGWVTTIAGNGGTAAVNGAGYAASFNTPSGIAVDASGNLYIADLGNQLIRVIR